MKWKPSASGGDGFNNTPRRELAAYVLQRLFLDPADYVVPPTVGRCFAVARYAANFGSEEDETFEGAGCVFGLMAYWLQNVTWDDVYDAARFERDPKYRRALANLNLLTYLMDHRDSRKSNFLISSDPKRPRAFAVDNGLAFGGLKNPVTIFGARDWSDLFVSRVPRAGIERLRKVTRAQLDALGVVAQYQLATGAMTRMTATANLDREEGVRREGTIVQFGLNEDEVDAIAERLAALLANVDAGRVTLF